MSKLPHIEQKVTEWQDTLLAEYQRGRRIHFKNLADRVCIAYSEDPPTGRRKKAVQTKFHMILPRVKAIVVGLDIREYSRRDAEQQLFLTLNLHISITKAVKLLRKSLILPPYEPLIIIRTGDGAFVVFTLLEAHDPFSEPEQKVFKEAKEKMDRTQEWIEEDWKNAGNSLQEWVEEREDSESRHLPTVAGRAMSFVFALNSIMSNDNAHQGFVADSAGFPAKSDFPTISAFPAESRFAVSFDEVLLLTDENGGLSCVGHGMVTCARILSTDRGRHLLIDYGLLRALEGSGGLQNLCGGVWEHRLHSALLDDVKVKSGEFRYTDVFGFYSDKPLLRALRRTHEKPVLYHIGSHNMSSIASV